MSMSEKQEQRIKRMPVIETQVRKSKDGKYLLHRTVITHIRPMAYYQAILEGGAADEELDVVEGAQMSA